ncbi:membrane bound O-acyl transferase family protein [Nitzschia inconspicua]|uniref:Membrane bound O-acyl transferase family protein n=1 Tax=Nitzschia inconspicua TaxID=303405 RepID=A0A9K3KKM4_9STRA|nr:membrane bound O-acyl transferase family protein [Nitzschia inconspicua]
MILPHLAEADYREPLFTFNLDWNDDKPDQYQYGFYFISPIFWISLIGMILLESCIAALTGLLLYKIIVEPKRSDTAAAMLLGWGIIIPFWIFYPVVLIHLLDIRNAIFKFVLGCIYPVLCIFRTTECMYGFTPTWIRSSTDYVSYYASILLFARDPQTQQLIPCPLSSVLKHLINFIIFAFVTGILQSMLTPFPSQAVFGGAEDWYALDRFWTWQLYANSLLHAVLFQMYLTTYCEGLTLAFTGLSGYQTMPVMLNPLLKSQSPLDFWGRRWNLLVHHALKNGVFRPVRKYLYSTSVAVVVTFLASGVFHEWLLWAIFTNTSGQLDPMTGICVSSCYQPTYGTSILFFVWQAFLIAIELMVGRTAFFRHLGERLPRTIKTSLIVAAGLPIAHFFMEPYFRCGFFFLHAQPGLPMILKIK